MRFVVAFALLLVMVLPVLAVEEVKPAEKTVTLEAKDMPVADALKKISEQTGTTVLAEKLVSGNVTVSIKDAPIEKALGLVVKPLEMMWMKVYVQSASPYAKNGDALAAQVRLLLGLKFPDIVVAPTASYSPVVHLQKDSIASDFIKKMGAGSELQPVYLVTNDKAYTKKALKEESKTKAKEYVDLNKKMMEMFIAMTPEERAEAMKQGMQMTMQMGPEVMMDMMNTVMQMDPQYMADMNSKAMQAVMNMDSAARRNLLRTSIRSQMQMMKNMSPEQMQQFQKETGDIVKELIESGEIPNPAGGAPAP
jgi:type II secretory pathway component GspD/PulD (secretin)